MSSLAVRTLVKNFIAANAPDEHVVDLTAQFGDLKQMLGEEGVTPDSPWLGVEFITDGEEPVSLYADNKKGLYREVGLIQLHFCTIAKIGAGASLIARAEVLQKLFRGERLGALVVERISPINTGPGATLEFEAGYVSGTVSIYYHFDLTPEA